MKLLFTGDSITDSDHLWDDSVETLGQGYVKMISDYFKEKQKDYTIINQGFNGFCIEDLQRKWQEYCLSRNPDYVTILIGVNNIALRMNAERITTAKEFYLIYKDLIKKIKQNTHSKIILMEPFLFFSPAYLITWRKYLFEYIEQIRKLAYEYKTGFIPLDAIMAKAAIEYQIEEITIDGLHLTELGHKILMEEWIKEFIHIQEKQ